MTRPSRLTSSPIHALAVTKLLVMATASYTQPWDVLVGAVVAKSCSPRMKSSTTSSNGTSKNTAMARPTEPARAKYIILVQRRTKVKPPELCGKLALFLVE